MAENAATQQRIAGPRWILGGRWRRRLLALGLWWSFMPVVLVVVAAVVLFLRLGGLVALVVLLGATSTSLWRPVRSWWTVRWFRARWYLDARAGGLAVEAEPNLWPGVDAPLDKRIVCVPRARIALTPTGRQYRVRPLAGQVIEDFERAAGRLVLRWRAASVRVEHTLGDRFVVLVVDMGVPQPSVWEAPR